MDDATDDHVYLSLAEGQDDADTHWAFGTGFHDPLHGVDSAVPDGVDPAALAALCLALGDDALVSAQRLAEWCTRAPELEEEVALANIGLDLLGQARLLYARCGQVDGTGRGEDAYAYFRDADEFRNVRLAELPGGDFAFAIVRLLVLSAWRLTLFGRLASTADPVLAAIAAKGVPELTYHRRYAAEWAVRLGDGTDESRLRMRGALEQVAPYLDELFAAGLSGAGADSGAEAGRDAAPEAGPGAGPDAGRDAAPGAKAIRDETLAVLQQVLTAGGLDLPAAPPLPGAGRDGGHTPHLAPLLAELQSVARAHPEATW
jgi:ring-1,2-phenylacetyl-CoA epoxidase subunit PaaC